MTCRKETRIRARATLVGLALGDALGMPAQTLPRQDIVKHYGRIDGFLPPFEGHPVSHGLQAAQVTDDTEQALLLAKRLVAQPSSFDDAGWAQDLLTWEKGIRAKGLADILGPSSRAAINALLAGTSPEETGRRGTTNGGAMRIAPVGIMTPPDKEAIVAKVVQTCRVTHNTGEAIAAASAVAMMISCGISGQTMDTAIGGVLDACRAGQTQGYEVGEHDMAGRIELALRLAEHGDEEVLIDGIGTSVASRESIPMAFGVLKLAKGQLWDALLIAANAGDDTDTIGAIVGAMAGALGGQVPATAETKVMTVNALVFDDLLAGLLAQRAHQSGGTAG